MMRPVKRIRIIRGCCVLAFMILTNIILICVSCMAKEGRNHIDESVSMTLGVSWQGYGYQGTYFGEVKNNIPKGYGEFQGKYTSASGEVYEVSYNGKWKDGKIHGSGKLIDYYRNFIYDGTFASGMLDGDIKIFRIDNPDSYVETKYVEDVPCNVSWSVSETGRYTENDSYYRGISVEEICEEADEAVYSELVSSGKENMYRKVSLTGKIEEQLDLQDVYRKFLVSDLKGNVYVLLRDILYSEVATNYVPFFENGDEIEACGYFTGMTTFFEGDGRLYPQIQIVYANRTDKNDLEVNKKSYFYDTMLNYPYHYQNELVEIQGTITGILRQNDKNILILVESTCYGSGKSNIYACRISKKENNRVNKKMLIPGQHIELTGALSLLVKYDTTEEMNLFCPLIATKKIVELGEIDDEFD